MGKTLDRLFPLREIRNVGLFYVLTSVYNLWFVAGIWVFIWSRFITKTEIGISDAITFTVGFLLELPSGVIADLIGRKKAILAGNILMVIGNFWSVWMNSFMSITGGYLVFTIGYAFQSGATEALAYDSVKLAGKQDQWNKVIGTAVIITRVTSMTANVIGGLLFAVWFRLPYLVWAAFGTIGIIAALRLTEIPVKTKGDLWSVKAYLDQIKAGVGILFQPGIKPVAIISLTVAGMAYLYNWGMLRTLTGERFGYTAVTLPLLLAAVATAVIAATVLLMRSKLRSTPEKTLFIAAGIYAGLFVLLGKNFDWLAGGLIMILVTVTSAVVDQLFSQFINLHTKSEHRATTLSAVALMVRLPHVLLAVILGILAEKQLLPQFCLVAGGVAGLVWVVSLISYRRQASGRQTGQV